MRGICEKKEIVLQFVFHAIVKNVLPLLRAVTREMLHAGFSQTAVYSTRLQEGACPLLSFKVQGSAVSSGCKQKASEGWTLKEAKRVEKFNENWKSYLQAKFNIDQASGRKLDPEVVAKEMRRARAIDGKEVISCRGIPVPPTDIFFSFPHGS